MGLEVAETATAFLPAEGSRMEVVDDAGHFLQLEQPDVVNRLVLDFVTP
jgi:pimeloyl-ACP methyl ester carboxylesterase